MVDLADDGDVDECCGVNDGGLQVAPQLLSEIRFHVGASHAGEWDGADLGKRQGRSRADGEGACEYGVAVLAEEDPISRLEPAAEHPRVPRARRDLPGPRR